MTIYRGAGGSIPSEVESTIIPVSQGGTGATTIAEARTNLNAAKSGINSDITQLLGLEVPLSVAQGGTGANNAEQARTSLGAASSAQGAKADTALQPADVATVATSGSYNDLTDKPTVPDTLDSLTDVTITSATADQVLKYDGSAWINASPTSGTGDVVGPASATDGAVALFDGTTGKLLKNGVVLGSAATTSSGAYATASQGSKADSALQPATIGVTVQGYNANTVVDASYVHTDNNYTTTEKSKLSGIASGAEVNVNADWTASSGDSQILNKPTLGTAAATDSSAYATAAQGAKADSAVQTETDPVYLASSWYSTTNNSSNWNTAYGWGNHASAGYLTSSTAASTYAPLTGTGTSGTWSIDISGNAATATNATSATSATSATTATNLAGGLSGSVPYQTASGTTTMLAKGTDGQILTLASGVPSWAAAPVTGVTLTDDTTTNGTRYLTFTDSTSGTITSENVSSTKLQYNPSTGTLTSTTFSGAGTGLTGTASSLSIGGNAATVTDGVYTSGSYSDPTWITSLAGSKVSGNISGNAGNVTGTVAIANGGSGQTTAQTAMNAFAGAVTSGSYLRGDGTNVAMSTIQAADVPTLNQNTTGTAANITASSNSTLTTLSALSLPGSQVSGDISGNAANVTGTVAIANGGTGQTTATAAFDALAPTTTKGDLIVSDGSDNVRLAVGTNDYILTADSTTATGVKWAASAGGGSNITTKVMWENALTISTNYTITTGNSAMSAGPITISSGTSVTVPSGSRWVIV